MSAPGPFSTLELLLPRPWKMKPAAGSLRLEPGAKLVITGDQPTPEPIREAVSGSGLAFSFSAAFGDKLTIALGQPSQELSRRAEQKLSELVSGLLDERIKEQAYVIEIDGQGALAAAKGEAGLFYAAVTMGHLIAPEGLMPCLSLQDRPALAYRAVLLDVSRGRVPLPAALKEFVDALVCLKFNQLTLNIEHVFSCDQHPRIGAGHDPLTPEELSELSDYCRDRHLELIPFQQSLGHLRGIVSRPEYNRLAYDRELLWSVDPSKEETYTLLSDLYAAQAAAGPSRFFHAGCDEPFDLMKKFDPARFSGRPLAAVIRDHLIKLHRMIHERGRTMMAWADAVLKHPEILPDLPDDLVLCHWKYGSGLLEGPEHYRPELEILAGSGKPFYACTSSWSLMKLFPDLEVMRQNHDAFMPRAKELGACGSMITIWGDMGHMNLMGLELYPLAYAARHAWEDAPDPGLDFNAAFSHAAFRDSSGKAGSLAVRLNQVNELLKGPAGMAGVGFLLFFEEPLSSSLVSASVKALGAAAAGLKAAVKECRALLAKMEIEARPRRALWLDHHLPALQLELLARKLELIDFLKQRWPVTGTDKTESVNVMREAADRSGDCAQLMSGCLMLLESRWLCGSKPSALELNRERYRRLIRAWQARADEFRELAEKLEAGEPAPPLDRVIQNSPAGYCFNALSEMGLLGLL